MSVESASNRRGKRIVEHVITGFANAQNAIMFGNTLESLVKAKVKVKFQQGIGARNSDIAITKDFDDETVLKVMFLEVPDQNAAMFICDTVKVATASHKEVYQDSTIEIANEIVREKPQPQFIG